MDSTCGKLFMSIIVLPFAAGHVRRRRNGQQYHDCSISSRVLLMIIATTVLVFTSSPNILTHAGIRRGMVMFLLTVIMVCTMLGILSLAFSVQRHGLLSVVAARRNTSTMKLQMIFLWVFGLASGFYCAFFLAKQLECFSKTNGDLFWNILFCFNVTLILSIFVEMVFLSYFSHFQLRQTTSVNCVMFLALTANISVILYIYFVRDTFELIKKISADNNLVACIERNSTIIVLLHKSSLFLGPAFAEYALLSITILLEIWSPIQSTHSESESRDNDPGDSEHTTMVNETNQVDSERLPLIPSSDDTQPGSGQAEIGTYQPDNDGRRKMPYQSCSPMSEIEVNQQANSSRQKVSHIFTLAGSLITGLGLVICYITQAMDIGNLDKIRYATEMYELALTVIMTLVLFIGFFCLINDCVPDKTAKPLRPCDYVYLLSAFGVFMFHFYEILGGDILPDSATSIFFYKSILSLFQDYLQVVFLLQANRCQKGRSKVDLLESVLIFTMIMNVVFWFTYSFLIAEFPSTRILENAHFSKELLDQVYGFLLSVAVFFRFTSFLEYYATFGKYNS
ncbi:uncharacterized protein LOC132548070 [Ylistrum balloti]|uniref:uncharacterized protein LOC132548070 n=1 Tax=Ylistrum balloti TaxID=509963 RepID=UPI002905C476|nr:uncharacterized protein LOC132548070 [Ylistrum balloti]